jgi:hypothetical protein
MHQKITEKQYVFMILAAGGGAPTIQIHTKLLLFYKQNIVSNKERPSLSLEKASSS